MSSYASHRNIIRRQRAQSMTEYVLILSAVAVVAFGAYTVFGNQLLALMNSITAIL